MKLLNHRFGYNPYGLKKDGKYAYTREETKAFFRAIEITDEELADLNEWIREGNEFYGNPWHIYNEGGYLANFIDATRDIKEMYEDYHRQILVSPSVLTDSAFLYDDVLPF